MERRSTSRDLGHDRLLASRESTIDYVQSIAGLFSCDYQIANQSS